MPRFSTWEWQAGESRPGRAIGALEGRKRLIAQLGVTALEWTMFALGWTILPMVVPHVTWYIILWLSLGGIWSSGWVARQLGHVTTWGILGAEASFERYAARAKRREDRKEARRVARKRR